MFETVFLLLQVLSLGALAAWLSIGVWDNIRHPEINEGLTADVLSMGRMSQEYPEEHALMAHRAITSRATQKRLFRLIVAAEALTLLCLWGATFMLLALGATETARALALIAVMMFCAIWAGFLIAGNYFCYWFCHEGSQATHFYMLFWGLGTILILLA